MGTLLLRDLNVRVVGSGEEVLVLAHGFGTDQSAWKRILPFFPDHRIVLFDLACAGTVDPHTFDFARYTSIYPYVDDLLRILDALRIRRCSFVGHSYSAMTGVLASIARPALFTQLILISASPRFVNDGDYIGGVKMEDMAGVLSAMETNYEAWVRGFAPLAVGADVPEAVQEFSRTLFNMRPDITLFVSRVAFSLDVREDLASVRVPCHIIATKSDVSVPPSLAAYLQTHLAGQTTVEILPTEGHLPQLSAPALLAGAIWRALRAAAMP